MLMNWWSCTVCAHLCVLRYALLSNCSKSFSKPKHRTRWPQELRRRNWSNALKGASVKWLSPRLIRVEQSLTDSDSVWTHDLKLQALVYDSLPPTTYTIGLWKLSANEQFFLCAIVAVNLQQKLELYQTQMSNKTKTVWIKMELFCFVFPFFFYLGWTCLMFTCLLGCHIASTVLLQTFLRALTALVHSYVETNSAPSEA